MIRARNRTQGNSGDLDGLGFSLVFIFILLFGMVGAMDFVMHREPFLRDRPRILEPLWANFDGDEYMRRKALDAANRNSWYRWNTHATWSWRNDFVIYEPQEFLKYPILAHVHLHDRYMRRPEWRVN